MYFFTYTRRIKLILLQRNLRRHSARLLKARGNLVEQNYHCQKLLVFSRQLQELQILMQEEANIKAAKTIISHFEKFAPNMANEQSGN